MRAALIAMTLPAAALAETVCVFDAECVEAEPCAGADYAVRIAADGTLRDDAGSVATEALSGAARVGGRGEGAYAGAFGAMIITRSEDGAARLTVHFEEGPMAITYHGTCEAAS